MLEPNRQQHFILDFLSHIGSKVIYPPHTPFFLTCTEYKKLHLTMEKAMAPHSSTLAWKIPWMEEPGRLQSMGVAKSRTRLSDFTFTFHFPALEKEMATHSNVLAWRIPGTAGPGGTESDTAEVT